MHESLVLRVVKFATTMLCLVQGISGTPVVAGDRNSKINSSEGSSSEKLDGSGNSNVKWGMLRKSRYLCFLINSSNKFESKL